MKQKNTLYTCCLIIFILGILKLHAQTEMPNYKSELSTVRPVADILDIIFKADGIAGLQSKAEYIHNPDDPLKIKQYYLDNHTSSPQSETWTPLYESNFSTGTDGWWTSVHEDRTIEPLTVEDSYLKVEITDGGALKHSVQILHTSYQLQQGATYRLSFHAKSLTGINTYFFTLQKNADPWTSYPGYTPEQYFTPTTGGIDISFEFIMTDTTSENDVAILFNLGNQGTDILYLKDIKFEKMNKTEIGGIETAPVPVLSSAVNFYSTKYGTDTPLTFPDNGSGTTVTKEPDSNNHEIIKIESLAARKSQNLEYADDDNTLETGGMNRLHLEVYAEEALPEGEELQVYLKYNTTEKTDIPKFSLSKGWNSFDFNVGDFFTATDGLLNSLRFRSYATNVTFYLDHIYFYYYLPAAEMPNPSSHEVINIYSTKYDTENTGFNFTADETSGTETGITNDTNNNLVIQLSNFDKQAIEYENKVLELDGKNFLHFNVFAKESIPVKVKLQLYGSEEAAKEFTSETYTLTANDWNAINLDIRNFLEESGEKISAIELINESAETTTLFLDHMYFYTRIPGAPKPALTSTEIINFYSTEFGINEPLFFYKQGDTKADFEKDLNDKQTIKISGIGSQQILYYGNNDILGLGNKNQLHLELYPFTDMPITLSMTLNANKAGNTSRITVDFVLPETLKANQWNAVDIDITKFVFETEYNLSSITIKNDDAATSVLYADHIYFYYTAVPTHLPYLPTARHEGYVKSVYSRVYEPGLESGFPKFEAWGEDHTTIVSEVSIFNSFGENSYNKAWRFQDMNQQVISLATEGLNISDMEYLTLDIYPVEATSIDIFLNSGESEEYTHNHILKPEQWNRLIVPLTDYLTNGVDLTTLKYLGFYNGGQTGFYISNVYFYKDETLPAAENIAEVNKKLGGGVNLGNTFEDSYPGSSGNNWNLSLLRELIDSIADLGFKHIRLPVKWSQDFRCEESAPYTINPAFLRDSVQYTLDYVLEKGLKVILNIHHYDEFYSNPTVHKPRFESMWIQLSEYFKNYSYDLLFEILNEPHDPMTTTKWNEYLQDALAIIRKANPERPVLIGTGDWGGLPPLEQLRLPVDENIIATVHLYNPGYIVNQGWSSVGNEDIEWWDTEKERETVLSQFKVVDDFHIRHPDVPLNIGEFGIYKRADTDSRALWTAYVRDLFQKREYSSSYWEFRAGFGIYDVNTKKYNQPVVDALFTTEVPDNPAQHIFKAKSVIYDMNTDGTSGWSNTGSTVADTQTRLVRTFKGGDSQSAVRTAREFHLSADGNKTYRASFKCKTSVEGFTFKVGALEAVANRNLAIYMFTPETNETEVTFTFALLKTVNPTRITFSLGAITGDTEVTLEISDFIVEEIEKIQEAAPLPGYEKEEVYNLFSSTYPNDKTLTFSTPGSMKNVADSKDEGVIQLSDFSSQTITFTPIALKNHKKLHLTAFAGSAMNLTVKVGTKTQQFNLQSHTWTPMEIDVDGLTSISSIELSGGTGKGRKLFLDHIYFYVPIEAAPTPKPEAEDVLSILSTKYNNIEGLELKDTAIKMLFDSNGNEIPKVEGNTLTIIPGTGISGMDLQTKSILHVDIFPTESAYLFVDIYDQDSPDNAIETITLPALTADVWNSFDIPLNDIIETYTGTITKMIIRTADNKSIIAFIDHIYFREPSPFAGAVSIVWTGSTDNNWNNRSNWNLQKIPDATTDVYIPGTGVIDYPYLTGNKKENICRNIYFMQGAQVGRIDLLTYERAHIQINLGLKGSTQSADNSAVLPYYEDITEAWTEEETKNHLSFSAANSTAIDRNRWYFITPVLKNSVSGDLGFGGYPLTYQMQVEVNEAGINVWSSPYNDQTMTFTPGKGLAYWVNDYSAGKPGFLELGYDRINGSFTYTGLKETNGIMQLPYYENKYMSAAHRVSNYDSATGKSTFSYFDKNSLEILKSQTETFDRSPLDYRFISEDDNGNFIPLEVSLSGATGIETMIGNPFMSAIDFDLLFLENMDYMENYYRIWDGSKYITYTYLPGGGVSTGNLNKNISPMQGFLITKYGDKASTVELDLTKITAGLCTEITIKEKISIQAQNHWNSVKILLIRDNRYSDNYKEREDIRKLFTPNQNVPEIYTYVDGKNIEINFISGEEIIIPVGLKTNGLGETILRLEGMDNFDSKIYFIDKEEGLNIELSGMNKYEYTFTNKISGIQNDRFELHLAPKRDDVDVEKDETARNTIHVYATKEQIRILTDIENPIVEVCIYDTQGRLIFNDTDLKHSDYTAKLSFNYGKVCILRVTTIKGIKRFKLVR